MNQRIVQLLLVAGVVAASAHQAAADPIQITGGGLGIGTVSGRVTLAGGLSQRAV